MKTFLCASVLAGAFVLHAAAPAAAAAPLSTADRLAVADAVAGIGLHADRRHWARAQDLLDEHVTTDYVSLFGGEVATAPRAALVAQWQGVLPGFDATQHLISNVLVEGAGDEAQATSHVRATHWIGSRSWTVGGIYTHRLVRTPLGWRVRFMGLQRLYEEGDRALIQEARAKLAGDPR